MVFVANQQSMCRLLVHREVSWNANQLVLIPTSGAISVRLDISKIQRLPAIALNARLASTQAHLGNLVARTVDSENTSQRPGLEKISCASIVSQGQKV